MFVAVAVGSVVAPFVRGALAARKRRRYVAGEATRITVRARGGAPFPRRWAWGSVDTAERPLTFRRWVPFGRSAPLTGLTLVGRQVAPGPGVEELVVFRLRPADGGVVELGVSGSEAALFEQVLRDTNTRDDVASAGPPRRRMPRWRLVAAALGLAWLGAWAYLVAAGTVLDATVVRNKDDGYCDVEWVVGGRRESAEVDCTGSQPGEPLRIIALPAPFAGEAVDVVVTRVAVPLIALPFLLPLGLHAAGRLRRRDGAPPAEPTLAGDVADAVPRLDRHELRWSRVAETVTWRAEVEQWDVARVPWWLRPFHSSRSRLVAGSLAGVLPAPLFLLLGAALVGWTPVTTALRFDPSAAVVTTATVEVVDGFVAPIPWDVEVVVHHEGRERSVRIAMLREPDTGDRLTVRYDPRNDVARLPGDTDGTARGVLIGATLLGAALGLLGWRAARVTGTFREFRRVRALPPAPMRYAVVLDPEGAPAMLLFDADGDPRPAAVVGFAYLPADVPVTGPAEVHGTPADGELVLVRVGDHLLHPNDRAAELGTAVVRDLVNGDLVVFGEDDEDGGTT